MSKHSKNDSLTFWIVMLIIMALIFVPIIISSISKTIETSNGAKHEAKLIEEGKVKTHNEVINETIEILKSRDETKLKTYLAKDFIYYDHDNIKHKYLDDFWFELDYLIEDCYEIEKRGDIYQEEKVTYWIYWNVVKQNKNSGVHKSDINYCLQKICIYLRRLVKENEITYEIERIRLVNN